jgi:hypothetical protein
LLDTQTACSSRKVCLREGNPYEFLTATSGGKPLPRNSTRKYSFTNRSFSLMDR